PAVDPSLHPLGATPVDRGVVFRVWAPHAESVDVIGTWNDFESSRDPLAPGGEGVWQGWVEAAREGHEYRFEIRREGRVYRRIDPRAREVTHSIGNGVVTSDRFDWGDDEFVMPPHNRLVIYELHAPTFSAAEEGG